MKFWIIPFYAVIIDKVLTKIEEKFVYIYFRDPIEPFLEYKKVEMGKNCIASIGFFVHDISPEKVYDKSRNWIIFSKDDAKKLVKFVKMYINDVSLIVCQCSAGISRSSATAAALDECINEKGKSNVWIDRRFVPNKLIYNLIKGEWLKND